LGDVGHVASSISEKGPFLKGDTLVDISADTDTLMEKDDMLLQHVLYFKGKPSLCSVIESFDHGILVGSKDNEHIQALSTFFADQLYQYLLGSFTQMKLRERVTSEAHHWTEFFITASVVKENGSVMSSLWVLCEEIISSIRFLNKNSVDATIVFSVDGWYTDNGHMENRRSMLRWLKSANAMWLPYCFIDLTFPRKDRVRCTFTLAVDKSL